MSVYLFRILGYSLLTAPLLVLAVGFSLPVSKADGEDLIQDYLSARAWLRGEDPYQDLAAMRAANGFPPTEPDPVASNPHPPLAFLVTLPIAWLPFPKAFYAWKLLNVGALAIAWNWSLLRFARLNTLTAIAGTGVGFWAPVWQGLDFGQPVGFIALGTIAAWQQLGSQSSSIPRFRGFGSGLLIGLLCTLRPYFFILSSGGMAANREQLLRSIAGAVVGGIVPFLAVGTTPWSWWLRNASDSAQYANIIGTVGGVLRLGSTWGIVLFLCFWVGLSIARRKGLPLDATVALAMAAILWAYPLAWYHADVLMIPGCVWIGVEGHRRDARWPFLALMLYIMCRAYPSVQEHYQLLMYVQFVGRTILLLGIFALLSKRR